MSIYTANPETREGRIGKQIYQNALYDRKGFHEDDIDDEIWIEIFEHMGREALGAIDDH